MAKMQRSVDLVPMDRLEEKVKLLVAMLGRLRDQQARLAEENSQLGRALEAARARLAEVDSAASEIETLKEEREHVRARVAQMLDELEALNL